MSHLLRIVWVIARRDYVAIVFSRRFLLFLAIPGIAAAIGAAFGAIGAQTDAPPAVRPLVVIADARDGAALAAARGRLARAFGGDALPPVTVVAQGDPARLLADRHAVAVLDGPGAHPRILLAPDAPSGIDEGIERLVAEARARPAAKAPAASAVTVTQARHGDAAGEAGDARVTLAKGAQYAIFLFTIGLAGRLLANFIEERGNKVIELLVAAVPVDAIFYGKLLGMLMFSFTCIVAWVGGATLATALAAPQVLQGLATPAVGWPGFVLLGAVYFALSYLLIGTVMLGLGAQTRTPADIQTLALPITMAQLGFFGLARMGVADPSSTVAVISGAVPWSASLTMIARAAEDPRWWPQLLSIAWQTAWLILSVRFASSRFRRAVLSSGPVRGGRR